MSCICQRLTAIPRRVRHRRNPSGLLHAQPHVTAQRVYRYALILPRTARLLRGDPPSGTSLAVAILGALAVQVPGLHDTLDGHAFLATFADQQAAGLLRMAGVRPTFQ